MSCELRFHGNMTLHPDGGAVGGTHVPDQFEPAFEAWWAPMSTPGFSGAAYWAMIDAAAAEVRGRSIARVVAERDAILVPQLERTGARS
jgi:hypothetical protein